MSDEAMHKLLTLKRNKKFSPTNSPMAKLAEIASHSPVFIYTKQNGDVFRGDLIKFQCDHTNPITNVRCKRTGYIGYKTCWQHMRSDLKVKIKKSTIQDAGKGLFAECPKADRKICFKRNDFIVDYNGQVLNEAQLNLRYGEGDDNTAPYAIQIKNKDNYEDAALQRSIGSTINFPPNNKTSNVKLWDDGNKVFIKALKQIKHGEELFSDYGNDYQFDSNYRTTR